MLEGSDKIIKVFVDFSYHKRYQHNVFLQFNVGIKIGFMIRITSHNPMFLMIVVDLLTAVTSRIMWKKSVLINPILIAAWIEESGEPSLNSSQVQLHSLMY